MKLPAALIQFSRTDNKLKNVERMLNILSKVEGARIVCLPEAWIGRETLLGKDDTKRLLNQFGKVAVERNFYIFLGGFFTYRAEKIYSTCYVLNDRGSVEGYTDKLFPSFAVGERKFSEYGKASDVYTIDNVPTGIVVCVDVMYPEIIRNLALKGAKIIFNPSNIIESRINLWRAVGIARAAENTVFFAFINNTATEYSDGRRVNGQSFVALPDGEILVQANSSEVCIKIEFDLSQIDKVRIRWPYLSDIEHRRIRYKI